MKQCLSDGKLYTSENKKPFRLEPKYRREEKPDCLDHQSFEGVVQKAGARRDDIVGMVNPVDPPEAMIAMQEPMHEKGNEV